MENDFWNNPGLKNMSPEKLQLLLCAQNAKFFRIKYKNHF